MTLEDKIAALAERAEGIIDQGCSGAQCADLMGATMLALRAYRAERLLRKAETLEMQTNFISIDGVNLMQRAIEHRTQAAALVDGS